MLLGPSLALAQPAKKSMGRQEIQELREVMARRVTAATGLPVRIGDLRFEMLASRFVGSNIEVGTPSQPLLRLPRLVVGLAFFSGGASGGVVNLVHTDQAALRMPGRWLERPLRQQRWQALTLKRGQFLQSRITLITQDGAELVFSGVDLTLTNIVISPPQDKKPWPLSGSFRLTAQEARAGGLLFSHVQLEGTLIKNAIQIQQLSFSGLEGKTTLSGRLGLGRPQLGPLRLKGSTELRPLGPTGPRLRGPITLAGKLLTALRLKVHLQVTGKGLAAKGGLPDAPALPLAGRVGTRRLRGTLKSWRLK